MRRVLALIAMLLFTLGTAMPALALDQPGSPPGRVLIAVGGDLTIPPGEVAETVLVVRGHLDVQGQVTTVVVIDGTASLRGATVGDLFVVRGSATTTDTVIRGDIRTLDAQVEQVRTSLGGTARGMEQDLIALGWIIGLSAVLIWIGIGLATLVAGLALAGLAGRQVRTVTAAMRREPLKVFAAGIAGVILPPLGIGLLMATVVGIPLGIGLLLLVWPVIAFVGYLVAAVWVGEWVLGLANARPVEVVRPYRAMVVGLVVLFVAGFVPLVTAFASLMGLGGVLVAAWRTWRADATPALLQPTAMPA